MQIIVMIQKIVTPLLLKPGPFKIAYKWQHHKQVLISIFKIQLNI
jgi:hypothetical protein